jgi:hypothetical protein
MKTTALLSFTALLSCTLGCEVPEMEVASGPAAVGKQAEKTEKTKLFGKEDWYLPDGRVDMTGVDGEPPMTTSTPRPVTAKDPKKGKLTRRDGAALGTIVQTRFWAEYQTIFEIVIPSQLATYEALKGRPPKSHEEFMDDFIGEFLQQSHPGFSLPELEPGDEYIYDPEDKKLKIYRPEG